MDSDCVACRHTHTHKGNSAIQTDEGDGSEQPNAGNMPLGYADKTETCAYGPSTED